MPKTKNGANPAPFCKTRERSGKGLESKIHTSDGLCDSGMKSEHGLTMIGLLKSILAPRLRELARQVDLVRAQRVENWAWRVEHAETWIDHADEVLIEAQAEKRIAEQRCRAHATKSYSQWLHTAMHRRTTQTITATHPTDYGNSITPQQSMQARTEEWSAMWNTDTAARDILPQQMHSLRQQALTTTPHDWTAEAVRNSLSSVKGNRDRGVDGWTVGEMLRLPKIAIAGLVNVMQAVEESLALLTQICVNVVQGKTNGVGERPITLTGCLYAIFMACYQKGNVFWG